jgi:type VI secretion system protein ImpM
MRASEPIIDTGAPGWFGKVPMLGDFAHRRLPQAVVTRLDAWLSSGLLASRATLGEAWLAAYLSAPAWCFVCAPNMLDERWWLGVLTPNVDAAGRYFPLLVLAPQAAPPSTPDGLNRALAWCADAAQCAMHTLEPDASLASFEHALQGMSDASTDTAATDAAMAAWLRQRMAEHSLWWPHALDAASPSGPAPFLARGLPAPERFAAMWGDAS